MKFKAKLLPIILVLSLSLNVLLAINFFSAKERNTYLDGRYVSDFTKGIGERKYYFDIIFYENGTAFVQQRSFGSGTLANLDTTWPYYYSSESDTVTITFDWFGSPKTHSFLGSANQKEIYDAGFTLVRGFERDAENLALLPPKE